MGLDDLVKNKSSSKSSETKKSKEKSKKSKTKKTPVGGQKTLKRTEVNDRRPSEVKVKEDRSVIECMDCNECSRGKKAPVQGLSENEEGLVKYGNLMICDNIFCSDSIFDRKNVPLEFDRLEVHEQIVKVTGGPGIGGW